VILLTEGERKAVESLARLEKIPASTLARRSLLLDAEKRGIVAFPSTNENRAAVDLDTPRSAISA